MSEVICIQEIGEVPEGATYLTSKVSIYEPNTIRQRSVAYHYFLVEETTNV